MSPLISPVACGPPCPHRTPLCFPQSNMYLSKCSSLQNPSSSSSWPAWAPSASPLGYFGISVVTLPCPARPLAAARLWIFLNPGVPTSPNVTSRGTATHTCAFPKLWSQKEYILHSSPIHPSLPRAAVIVIVITTAAYMPGITSASVRNVRGSRRWASEMRHAFCSFKIDHFGISLDPTSNKPLHLPPFGSFRKRRSRHRRSKNALAGLNRVTV